VHNPLLIWLVAAGFGAALAMAQPAIQVLLLSMAPVDKRRDVFAWQFIALNLAAAAGAAVGGQLVDLTSQAGMRPVYAVAVLAALASAVIVGYAGHGHAPVGPAVEHAPENVSYAAILSLRPVRWLLGVALLITLACYAQYDAGLPAYVLKATDVDPSALGSAVAMNAVLVAVLTGPVVVFTRRRQGTSLLAVCAAIWVVCWLIFGLPLFLHGRDTAFVMLGFAVMSVGETMMAPILSPLAAALAPEGATGRTMAAVTGASTVATAIGPVLSSGLLGLGHPGTFILLQVACCVGAGVASVRLGRLMPPVPARRPSVLEQLVPNTLMATS
jgi:predicted MFS family arabinose efflux permease